MFSVLTSKLFGGLSIALAGALAWLYISTNATIASYEKAINAPVVGWRASLQRCTSDLATSQGNAATLTGSVARQNDAVQGVSSTAAVRYAQGAADRSGAALSVQKADALAAKLVKARAGADICASADQLILEYVK